MAGFVQPAAREPDRLSFESEVVAVDGPRIELAETYFFAESGGQPADRGTITDKPVHEVSVDGDRIVHLLREDVDIERGDTVSGEIDPAFRRYCRRAHTASHVLYGAARRKLAGLGYGGFEIGEEKIRVDFESDDPIDEHTLKALERLANEAVWESRSVSWEEVSRNEALENEDIAFNTATEEIFDQTETVRIVEIDGWDRAACGGTHLRTTAEIGPIAILDRSNPGSGLTRVEFAVGPTAISHLTEVHAAAWDVARTLDTSLSAIDRAVTDLEARLERNRNRVERLEGEIVQERLRSFDEITGKEAQWRIGTLPEVEGDVISTAVRGAVEDGNSDVVVGLTGDTRTAVSVASNGVVDANEVIDLITAEFKGGGGGNQTFAQGGGVDSSPAAVKSFIGTDVIE